MSARPRHLRILEALLFAAAEPLGPAQLARHLPEDADLEALLEELARHYAERGVNLVRVGERWAFRTAVELAPLMRVERRVERKLSRAALETLAIVAYHQPVTRGEIEEIRGVALSRGTLDILLEAGWVKPKGRRHSPGRPVTWGTTDRFLDHFSLESLESLPRVGELKAAGLLDKRPAIAAVGARGLGAEAEEAADETSDGDKPEESEPWEILSVEFGEDLVPEETAAEESGAGPGLGLDVGPSEARAAKPADGVDDLS